MFGVDTIELIIVAIAALLFIGPKELPAAMRAVGRWIGKARGMARHFTAGIDEVIREAELEEMERKWREENDRIMAAYPMIESDASVEARTYLGDAAPAEPSEPEEPRLPLEPPSDPRELP